MNASIHGTVLSVKNISMDAMPRYIAAVVAIHGNHTRFGVWLIGSAFLSESFASLAFVSCPMQIAVNGHKEIIDVYSEIGVYTGTEIYPY